ncbi:MAG: cytochrome P450, partial [Dehalococcoidia bacterium]
MVMFNPFLPSFLKDPYPSYAALRAREPVHRSMALQAWVITSYDRCVEVLRDPDTYSSEMERAQSQLGRALNQQRAESPLGQVPTALNSDPPTHTRLRGIVNRAFTPRTVEEMRPHIERLTAELLDAIEPGTPFDLMSALAQPLPVIVIAEMLGIPPGDRERFKRWSDAIAAATGVLTPLPEIEAARRAAQELIDYLEPIVEARRRQPEGDLLSALVQAEDEGHRLTRDELLAFAILLLVAGNETTTNLIGNGTLALLRNPDQLDVLRADPELLSNAIEELVRYDSPVQGVVRFTKRPADLGGQTIAEGDTVLVMLGAANRDPAHFTEPEVLDVRADRERHIAFGLGPHFCLGAPLARMEAEIAFRGLLERFPALTLTEDGPQQGGTFILRGLERLPLRG